MSSEVRILHNSVFGFTVTTGESVVIGHAHYLGAKDGAFDMADAYFCARRRHPAMSDSEIVSRLIEWGDIPGPTPDDN